MLKRNRIVVVLLVFSILAIPVILDTNLHGDFTPTLDTPGGNFWEGLACGLAAGAAAAAGLAIIAGSSGMAAPFVFSAGMHITAVCFLV